MNDQLNKADFQTVEPRLSVQEFGTKNKITSCKSSLARLREQIENEFHSDHASDKVDSVCEMENLTNQAD